jgi:hypothetical protein
MKSEYGNKGFLYTANTISGAIRASCGPLVVFRKNFVHLVHFSLKEVLTKPPANPIAPRREIRGFFVDTKMGNLQLMKICLDNLRGMSTTGNFFAADNGSPSTGLDFSKVNDRWPLTEYASLNWIHHAWQSGPSEFATLQVLRTFIHCKGSVAWIYSSLAIDTRHLERLRWNIRSLLTSLRSQLRDDPKSSAYFDDVKTCYDWCNFIEKIVWDYGRVL